MAEQTSRFEVQVAYLYYVCYTVDATSEEEALQKIIDGDGDARSNIAQPYRRLPPDQWKVSDTKE